MIETDTPQPIQTELRQLIDQGKFEEAARRLEAGEFDDLPAQLLGELTATLGSRFCARDGKGSPEGRKWVEKAKRMGSCWGYWVDACLMDQKEQHYTPQRLEALTSALRLLPEDASQNDRLEMLCELSACWSSRASAEELTPDQLREGLSIAETANALAHQLWGGEGTSHPVIFTHNDVTWLRKKLRKAESPFKKLFGKK